MRLLRAVRFLVPLFRVASFVEGGQRPLCGAREHKLGSSCFVMEMNLHVSGVVLACCLIRM